MSAHAAVSVHDDFAPGHSGVAHWPTETHCRKCGQPISKFHGHDSWVTARYLPVFGRATYLRYRPRR
ncbi:MAG: hypothetical protein FJ030_12805, partial [Chloroflexi bacterium]|nr:hypothetical protein [Chloroflexota bacterium]